MKKITSLFFVVIFMFTLSINIFAARQITVTLDGKDIEFDVQPTILDGRTMVPLRAIFEALGATVDWNSKTRTVIAERGNTNISLTINQNIMYVNGESVKLDVAATIINDRTLVPIRAISEAFNCKVGWDGKESLVSIINDTESYSMVYAPNNRSMAVPVSEIANYLKVGWYRNADLKTEKFATTDDITTFLKFVNIGLKGQNNALSCITNYIKYFDDEFKDLFFENLRTSYKAVNDAYDMSLKYTNLQETSLSLVNILNVYDSIFNGEYSPLTMGNAFELTIAHYNDIIDFIKVS